MRLVRDTKPVGKSDCPFSAFENTYCKNTCKNFISSVKIKGKTMYDSKVFILCSVGKDNRMIEDN